MLVKWIVCTVDPSDRTQFSQDQCHWNALSKAEGFVAQLGGWDVREPHRACILCLSRDEQAYAGFMSDLHDPIVEKSGQDGTYRDIEVTLGQVRLGIEGNSRDLSAAVEVGRVLRVADCTLCPGRLNHFESVQKQIWNPAMAGTGAVAGGVFVKLDTAQDRYLVATLWLDPQAHADYTRTQVPGLRDRAEVETDVARLIGYCVSLESAWLVLADRNMTQ
ncbi:MAG: YdbC family protein [Phycisphaerae bacterium]